MSKLREKFIHVIDIPRAVEIDNCVEITEDFAIKFAKWLIESPDTSMAVTEYTYDELLQIFKDNFYEK